MKIPIEFATPRHLKHHPQRLQSDVLNLLTNWCEMPETVLDIFLNFDNDTKLVHCALFSDMTAEIIELAAPSWLDDPTEASLAMNEPLLVRAAETLRVLTRSICNMSGTAMLQRAQEAVTAVMGNLKLVTSSSNDNDAHESRPQSPTPTRHRVDEVMRGATKITSFSTPPIESSKSLDVVERHTYREKRRKNLDAALAIAKKRENLRKAIKFLVAHDVLRNTPSSIGDFIRNYRAVLDPVWVGNYLGERGVDDSEIVFLNRVRRKYVEGLDLSELSFVAALRTFLTRGGFMLPKEAQKIDRLLQSFADVYFEVRSGSEFSCADTIYFLSFSTLLLNTSVVNPQCKQVMSKEEWIRSNEKCDPPPQPHGKNLPNTLLQEIYVDILSNPLTIPGQEYASSSSAQKKNKRKRGGLRDKEYHATLISNKMRSIRERMRHRIREGNVSLRMSAHKIVRSRALELKENGSLFTLTHLQFSLLWFDICVALERIVNNYVVPSRVRCKFLDIIAHCLSAAMFLHLADAKTSFARLLLKTVRLETCRAGGTNAIYEETMKNNKEGDAKEDEEHSEKRETPKWYTNLLCAESVEDIHRVIAELMIVIKSIKELMMTKHADRRLREVASMFSNTGQESLILKERRQFLKRGELIKISTRGAGKKYMFFLFNDMLVYASRSFSFKKSEEQYKSHRELNFKEGIKFIDLQSEKWSGKSGFVIVHPRKTFKVFAETELEKRQWMAALKSAKGVYYNTASFSPPPMATYGFSRTSGRDDSSESSSAAER